MHLQNVSNPNKNIALSLDTVPKIVVSLCVKTNPIPAETEASVRSMHTVEVYMYSTYCCIRSIRNRLFFHAYSRSRLFLGQCTVSFFISPRLDVYKLIFLSPSWKKKCRDPKLYIINIWHFLLKLEGSAAESDCFRSALAPAPTLTPAPGVQKAWGIFVHQILNYIKQEFCIAKEKRKRKKEFWSSFFRFFNNLFLGEQ